MSLNPARVRAAFAVRGIRLGHIAYRLNRSDGNISAQLNGMRPLLRETIDVLREVLGPAGFAYVSGQSDVLTESAPEPRPVSPLRAVR